VAVAAAIALIVLVIVGLRPRHTAAPNLRRTLVAAYIVRVGRLQVGMATQVRAIDVLYKRFAHDPATIGKHVAQYRRAQRTLAALRDRLATVDPPREARALQRLLLELAEANVRAAGAVAGLAAYLPELSKAQAKAGPALATLRIDVAKAATASKQAVAFSAYSATIASVEAQVARLRPPAFFAAAEAAQLAQLRRLTSLAAKISTALSHKQLKAAQTLVAEIGHVEADISVLRAQRAGALSYNAQIKRIRAISTQIDTERKRLEERLPA
jgi:hypothetical protein